MGGARAVIERLGLAPHPEGGWYRETWRGPDGPDGRSVGTAILYLLDVGEVSHWHRIDAAEVWHWHAGGPLSLTLSPDGYDAEAHVLGGDVTGGQSPQHVVPPGWWQTATSLGAWTLCGCTVAPGFEFDRFELAPPDWRPVPRGS